MEKGQGSDGPNEACLLHVGVLLVRAGSYKAPAKVLRGTWNLACASSGWSLEEGLPLLISPFRGSQLCSFSESLCISWPYTCWETLVKDDFKCVWCMCMYIESAFMCLWICVCRCAHLHVRLSERSGQWGDVVTHTQRSSGPSSLPSKSLNCWSSLGIQPVSLIFVSFAFLYSAITWSFKTKSNKSTSLPETLQEHPTTLRANSLTWLQDLFGDNPIWSFLLFCH